MVGMARIFLLSWDLFVAILKFVAIYVLFGRLRAKSVVFFIAKTVVIGQKVDYLIVYFTYCTDINLQICGENSKYVRWTKICLAIFVLAERLPTSATLAIKAYIWAKISQCVRNWQPTSQTDWKNWTTLKRRVVKLFELTNFSFQSCSIFQSVWLVGCQLRTHFSPFWIFAPFHFDTNKTQHKIKNANDKSN